MKRKSIMWDYIEQEPAILRELMIKNNVKDVANALGVKTEAIYLVCHGSSYNAAVSIAGFMSQYAGLRVYTQTPANFIYNGGAVQQEKRSTSIVVTISQTGTSRGCIEALRMAKELGFRTLGITDVLSSPIGQEATICLHLNCGVEDSNAKTKGYSATLLLLLLLAVQLGEIKGAVEKSVAESIRQELEEAVRLFPQYGEEIRCWCDTQKLGDGVQNVCVLGYGMNFGTAMEGQLKLMETMCIPTLFNNIEEFSHGMHRYITEHSTVLLLKTEQSLAKLTEDTFTYLKTKTDHVYMLDASEDPIHDPRRLALAHLPLTQSILLMTLAIQIFSVYMPEYNDRDPNADANNDYTSVVHTRIKQY